MLTFSKRAAALARSHMNGSLLLKGTVEQTTATMPQAPKTIGTAQIVYESCPTTVSVGYLRRLPLDRTGWPDRYSREQNSIISQICPVKSVDA